MIEKRRTNLVYLLVVWALISALAWPAFIIAATLLSFFSGHAWQLDAWTQIPKRQLLDHFLHGYVSSAIITVPLGLVAAIDHLLLSRYRLTWVFGGILLPIAGAAIALTCYQRPEIALAPLVLAGVLLAVVYRLTDYVVGNSRRGRIQ